MFFMLQILFVVTVIFTNAEWIAEMENAGLYEGDMILSPKQMKAAKNGALTYATTIGKQWPQNTVPYEYALDIVARPRAQTVIQQAIDEYHKHTCIRFVKRTTEAHYIQFYQGAGCSSYVGYGGGRGWPMKVSLMQNCWRKGIVVHELGHALGMFHEQSRPDRDNYVNIIWDNIKPDMKFNFNKQTSTSIDSLGTKYDFASIMHYGKTAFAKTRGLITIKTKDASKQGLIGNRKGLSPTDIIQINKLYRCGTIPPIPTTSTSGIKSTKKPTFTNRPDCKDEQPRSCPGWKSLCKSHPHIAMICKRTCKLC